MTYNVDYFIGKFSAIPEEKWCSFDRQNSYGQRCAHGHCHPPIVDAERSSSDQSEEELGLIKLANVFGVHGFAVINNGNHAKYQQPTPKQRMLAVLYDIKKLQDGDPQNKAITPTQPFQEITFEKIKEEVNIPQSVN